MKNRLIIYLFTFLVASWAIVYELIYCQMLTIIFGQTVLRYSVTIWLYLFCTGVWSIFTKLLNPKNASSHFWLAEFFLAFIWPLWLLFIVLLDNVYFFDISHSVLYNNIILILAHLPIVLIWFLVWLQIPTLVRLYWSEKKQNDSFIDVLAIDYFWSLVWAVVYWLLLYPSFWLVLTTIIVGIVNAFVSIFAIYFVEKKIIRTILNMVLIVWFLFALVFHKQINDYIIKTYFEVKVYKPVSRSTTFKPQRWMLQIVDNFQTPYQQITKYVQKNWDQNDVCLAIDWHMNLCDSWWEAYHNALVHVPMSLFSSTENLNALVIWWWSFISVKNLISYWVNVDQVDIDKQFIDYVKQDAWFIWWHQNTYLSSKLKIYYEDAYSFLRRNEKKYDIIVMSIPGYGQDKLMHLWSMEFFSFINRSLSDNGLFVSWEYPEVKEDLAVWRKSTQAHRAALVSSFKSAWFSGYLPYHSWVKSLDSNLSWMYFTWDEFWILSKNPLNFHFDSEKNEHTRLISKNEKSFFWHNFPDKINAKVNSVFAPNYDIITPY